MKRLLIFLFVFFLAISHISAANSRDTLTTPNPSKEAVALLRYLQDMFGKKTFSGQMWTPPSWGTDELGYIQDHTGKQPAILGIDFINESENSLGVARAISYAKSGGIITAMWHWGAPSVGEGYTNSEATIVIDSCFKPGTRAYKDFWAELKTKGDWLQQLRDAHVPVLWRPYHELNGGWFWWSKQGPAKFKELWDTMYNYFVYERGLNNLIWVLCYDGSPDAKWYPGKQYVDIAGGDAYGVGSSTQLSMFNQVKSIVKDNTMPLVYHECGVPPDPDQCLAQGAMWSWWMEWHTDWLTNGVNSNGQGVDSVYLKKVYNNELIITLDKVPNITAQYGWNADSCTASVISPQIMVDNGAWQQTNNVHIGSGKNVKLKPVVSDSGKWNWNGYGTSGSDSVQTVAINGTGTVMATFKNYCGATSTQSFNIVPCASTKINPFLQVEGDTMINSSYVSINAGKSVTLSPRPEIGGSWSWSGGGASGTSREQVITPDSTCTVTVEYTNDCGNTSFMVFTIYVVNTVNIKNTSPENSDVSIYPFPCKESLKVELNYSKFNSPSVISIYTMQGIQVIKQVTNLKTTSINTSGLKPGMYILSVVNNEFKISKRFVKVE
jgi:hypothetical protein